MLPHKRAEECTRKGSAMPLAFTSTNENIKRIPPKKIEDISDNE